jgi:hypothetical protein
MPGCQDRAHNIDSLGSEERFLFLSIQFLYVIERKFIITGDTVTEISYHIWSGDYTRTFYTPHR